ncbi:MAG: hypothetical protein RLZZ519_2858, partial [Bacteroidota bacterium]
MSKMALKRISQAKQEGWKRLDLGNCGIIDKVPEEIGELVMLEELILSEYWQEWNGLEFNSQSTENTGPQNRIAFLPAKLPPKLATLYAGSCNMERIDPLSKLQSLSTLQLSGRQLSDISPLAGLKALEVLHLSGTCISDLTPLQGLSALRVLDISISEVAHLTPLQE